MSFLGGVLPRLLMLQDFPDYKRCATRERLIIVDEGTPLDLVLELPFPTYGHVSYEAWGVHLWDALFHSCMPTRCMILMLTATRSLSQDRLGWLSCDTCSLNCLPRGRKTRPSGRSWDLHSGETSFFFATGIGVLEVAAGAFIWPSQVLLFGKCLWFTVIWWGAEVKHRLSEKRTLSSDRLQVHELLPDRILQNPCVSQIAKLHSARSGLCQLSWSRKAAFGLEGTKWDGPWMSHISFLHVWYGLFLLSGWPFFRNSTSTLARH